MQNCNIIRIFLLSGIKLRLEQLFEVAGNLPAQKGNDNVNCKIKSGNLRRFLSVKQILLRFSEFLSRLLSFYLPFPRGDDYSL